MKKIVYALIALLACSVLLSAKEVLIAPDSKVVYKKLGDGTSLQLHVFLPEKSEPKQLRSAIVFFYGGGWNGGKPEQFYTQAKALADEGMVAFCAEYRVKKTHQTTPFECVKDAKSAVRFLREHAEDFNINPEKIVAAGGSAGGHIAACTGLIDGYEEEGEDLKISSVPNAMVLFNPVLDTTEKGYGSKRFKKGKQTALSPCHHVKKIELPTLVLTGKADTVTPYENAERFTKLMKEAGNRCTLKGYEGQGHGFFNSQFFRAKLKDQTYYFLTLEEMRSFLKAEGML